MSENLSLREAYAEGASALRYRAERLRDLTASDDAVAAEMIARWTNAAIMLEAMAGVAK